MNINFFDINFPVSGSLMPGIVRQASSRREVCPKRFDLREEQ